MSYALSQGSYAMNEARKSQDAMSRQQSMAAQRQAEAQNYERGRQQFQEGIIAREQSRREQESKSAQENARFELEQRYRRDPLAHYRESQRMNIANAPAMAAAQAIGDMGGSRQSSSWLRNSLLG